MAKKSTTNTSASLPDVPLASEAAADSRSNVEATVEKIQAATNKLAQEVEKFVSDGADKIQRVTKDYAHKLDNHAGQVTEQAKRAYSESETLIRKNPVPSVLGAFAVGVILGVLLGRD